MKKCLFFLSLLLIKSVFAQVLMKSKDNAHENGILGMTMSNDGNVVLTAGGDNKTYVWNIKTGDKSKGALRHNDKITAIAVNGNAKYYASGSSDSRIRIVDIETGLPIRILAEHNAEITALAYNTLNDFLVSGSKDNTIRIWDNSKSKNAILTIKEHGLPIVSLAVSADGKRIYAGFADNAIGVYDFLTGELIQNIDASKHGANTLTLSSDGSLLATGGKDGTIALWNTADGSLLKEINAFKSSAKSIVFSPDLQFLFVAGEDKKIAICKVENGKTEKEFSAHDGEITALATNPAGDMLVSTGKDGALKTWDLSALKIGARKFAKSDEKSQLVPSPLTLKDDNNNGIIEGGEKANLTFSIRNQGKGIAFNVLAKIAVDKPTYDITFPRELNLGNIDAGKLQQVIVPLTVNPDVQSSTIGFSVTLTSAGGDNPTPLHGNFQTGGSSNYSYIMVLGQSFSSATGKAQIGAPITAKVKVKNITKTDASNIKVNFLLPEHVRGVNKVSEVIPSMKPGEEKEVSIDFFAESTFTGNELKMCLDIDGAAFTNAKEIIMRIKMNSELPKGEDYSGEVTAQAAQLEQPVKTEEHPLYRGGGDPLKGLNLSKAKEMTIGNYYALIIGVDKYKNNWPPLINAVNDAKSLEKTLKTNYKFEFFRTLYNEEASRESIIKELEWLVAHVKENDNVFIYYSGHGEYKKELAKGYWVPADADMSSTAKYLSNSDIQTYINGIKSKHTLLVADACFSGDIFRGNTISVPFEESEKYYREVNSLISRQALTSGGLEPVMDGGKEGHSVFAYYLLKSLDANQGKYFDVSQLYTKIKIPVINNSEQTPKLSPIKNAGDEGGQFIFIKK